MREPGAMSSSGLGSWVMSRAPVLRVEFFDGQRLLDSLGWLASPPLVRFAGGCCSSAMGT